MADPPPPPPPTLEYQQDPSLRAIRRGVRVLVLLTLVNTVLLGAGFFAPAITAVAREQWAAYQKSRADADDAAQRAAAERLRVAQRDARRPALLAAQAEAMSHLWPAGTLLFAEDFAVGTLPAVGTTSATLPATRNATTRGSAAASAARPAFLAALTFEGRRSERGPAVTDVPLFVHARRARPELAERLVLVAVPLETNDRRRRVLAWIVNPTKLGDPLSVAQADDWQITLPNTVRRHGESEPPALRFYAGTPDPLDDSAFTVRYEFGAGVGQLKFRLRADDVLDLRVDGPLKPIMPDPD